jgi:hypothetical protein
MVRPRLSGAGRRAERLGRFPSSRPGAQATPLHSRTVTPESQKPDLQPQLRELLKWYDEALGHIAAGAIVEPGEPERLKEEQGLTARLLEILEADERGELD